MSFVYGALGLLVVGAIVMAIIHSGQSVSCTHCARRFKPKAGAPVSSAVAGSNAEPSLFDPFAAKTSAPIFCSEQCRNDYQDNEMVTCSYKREHVFRRKDVRDTLPYCSEKCRNDAKASEGIKEERKRIIRE